jgi:transcriptional regulator with XRE-family HTH domain
VALEEEAIRTRIRQARDDAGLTQEQSADLHEVHKRTIENWENRHVPWDRIKDIARNYGVTEEWLLHGDAMQPSDVSVSERQELLTEIRELRALLERVAQAIERQD